jgi:hypothetical protein
VRRGSRAPKWEGRDLSNVGIERAHPKSLQEFGARLALVFGDDLDQVVAAYRLSSRAAQYGPQRT